MSSQNLSQGHMEYKVKIEADDVEERSFVISNDLRAHIQFREAAINFGK